MRTCITVAVALITAHSAQAQLTDLRVWVALEDDADIDPAALAAAGAEAVALPPALADLNSVAQMRAAGLRVLALLPLGGESGDVAADWDGLLVTALPAADFEGRPAWDVECGDAPEGSLTHLLAVKRSGDRRREFFNALNEATDLPIYLAALQEDAFPETARWRYLDRHALLSEGAIDGILLSGDALDLRRPRLSTPETIVAGIACQPEHTRAAMTILRSRDADVLLAPRTGDPVEWLRTLNSTLAGLQRAEQDRLEFAAAVEAGELAVVAGAEAEGDLDVATIHGVAQSFTLEEPADVVGVGLHCILRGDNPLGLPDLRVTIRPDADGAPDMETVLAEGTIPPAAFAEPGYQWGYARFAAPVTLQAGVTWWLHAADTQNAGNSFVWRITRDGNACPGGHAWSRRYDYAAYDWVFRVLAQGGDGE